MNTVTQWFPAGSLPKRKGVYEFGSLPFNFHYFDGALWLGAGKTPADAVRDSRHTRSDAYHEWLIASGFVWRGLAEKPQEAA